jgi:hypothetical protein
MGTTRELETVVHPDQIVEYTSTAVRAVVSSATASIIIKSSFVRLPMS